MVSFFLYGPGDGAICITLSYATAAERTARAAGCAAVSPSHGERTALGGTLWFSITPAR